MSKKRDYYEVLGINKTADDGAIKRAYRKLAKKYHPDTNPGNIEAEKLFKEVTEAYNVLSDPEKKKIYDRFGHDGLEGNTTGGYSSGFASGVHFENENMNDIFGDIFEDIFQHSGYQNSYSYNNGFRNGNFYKRDYSQKGDDLHADISVSFDEAAFGCEKVITLSTPGNPKPQSLKVIIPAGIDDGKSIRLRGKGMPGTGGGEPGDLLLKVAVGKKAGFERKGMDIYTTANIPFTTAVLGGEALVPTLNGNVVCKIQEGTQSGTKIRLRGKGIVSMNNPSRHGDQYVTIQIQVPKNLSSEAKQKLREFQNV